MKKFLKFVLVVVFIGSCSGVVNLYIIRKNSVNEKALTSVVENHEVLEFIYNEFMDIMTSDFIKLFSGIIDEGELKKDFRSAFPEERFKDSLKELMKNVAKFLQGKTDSPNYNLDLKEFNKALSDYITARADKEKDLSSKNRLMKYANVVKNYPEYFPMLRLDDVENIEELKKNIDNLKKPFVISIIALIISILFLLNNAKTLSLAIVMSGILNFIGVYFSRLKIADSLQKIPEPTKTIISHIASNITSTIIVVSIIMTVLGIIILIITRKKQGGK